MMRGMGAWWLRIVLPALLFLSLGPSTAGIDPLGPLSRANGRQILPPNPAGVEAARAAELLPRAQGLARLLHGPQQWRPPRARVATRSSGADGEWTNLMPPRARNRHSAVWDPERGQMLVFGGDGGNGLALDDLWRYTPETRAWEFAAPQGPAPAPRFAHYAVWDPAREQMLLFGGFSVDAQAVTTAFDDLWAYQPATNVWTLLTPPGPHPGARAGGGIVWDPERDQLLLFGGAIADAGGSLFMLADLWAYRPASNSWALLAPAGAVPPGRGLPATVWDPGNGQMLVFGGVGFGLVNRNDLWAYRPATNTWAQLALSGTRPTGRFGHTGVWDPAHAQFLVFGGDETFLHVFGDLWAYRPASDTWTALTSQPAPEARSGHSAVWYPAGGQMLVLAGGDGISGATHFGDLWSYAAATATWARLTPTAPAPPARRFHSATWDPDQEQLLVFGGQRSIGPLDVSLNDLWSYRASTGQWQPVAAQGIVPTGRTRHSAVWDPTRSRLLVFGGSDAMSGKLRFNDLWSYAPATQTWTELTPAGGVPPTVASHTAVWDPVRDQMLVFGGFQSGIVPTSELWAYRPGTNTWAQLLPGGPLPTPRYGHTAVWNLASGRMLVHGGFDPGLASLGDLWAFDPATGQWVQLLPAGATPGADAGHAAAWDSADARMLVFGGGDSPPRNDLWSYRPSTNTWAQLHPGGPQPTGRFGHAAAWDASRGRMLVFGGYSPGYNTDELWSYRPARPKGPTPTVNPNVTPSPPPTRGPATATPTGTPGPVAGRSFTLTDGAAPALSWAAGTATSALLIRWSPEHGFAFPTLPNLLPPLATAFTDPGPLPDPTYCYVLLALGGSPPSFEDVRAISDLLCHTQGTRNGTPPSQFRVALHQSTTASLQWTAPGGQDRYELLAVRFDGSPPRVIQLPADRDSYTDDTMGQVTCYTLRAYRGPELLGSTNGICGAPGIASFPTGRLPGDLGATIDRLWGR